MGATLFLLVVLHLLCFIAMSILLGIQYVHYVEYESKKIKEYSYLRFFISLFLMLFLSWILAVTGGFEESHWILGCLNVVAMITGIYLTMKILFKKKGLRYSDIKLNHE